LFRPCRSHRYSHPRGVLPLEFLPWHRMAGSHVPNRSLCRVRAASMPATTWAVSRYPPDLSRSQCLPRFW
jgi:hypothetical protein